MVTVTREQVLHFRRNQEVYSRAHSGQFSKFLYALNKVYTRTKSIEEECAEKEREIDLKYCTQDKDGYALQEKSTVKTRTLNGETREEEVNKFKFTVDALLNAGKEKRAFLNESVTVEEYITDVIPEDIDFNWWRVFSPFILPEEPSEEQLQKLYSRTESKTAK